jgi:hypothetical protein
MSAEVDFVPKFLTISCGSGVVKTTYGVKLTTGSFDDEIAGGEVDLTSEEIVEAVNNLTDLVLDHLRTQVGLRTPEETTLWSSTSSPDDEEDPL